MKSLVARGASNLDAVVSTLMANPVADWSILRDVEQLRLTLSIDPSFLSDSLEETRQQLDSATLRWMVAGGQQPLNQIRCLDPIVAPMFEHCCQYLVMAPYFTRELRASEYNWLVREGLRRHPWLGFLVFTDPDV